MEYVCNHCQTLWDGSTGSESNFKIKLPKNGSGPHKNCKACEEVLFNGANPPSPVQVNPHEAYVKRLAETVERLRGMKVVVCSRCEKELDPHDYVITPAGNLNNLCRKCIPLMIEWNKKKVA